MKSRMFLAVLIAILMILNVAPIYAYEDNPEVLGVIVNPTQPYQSSVWVSKANYSIGERISINYRTDRDAYVYIFDVDTTGKVSLLFPNIYSTNNYARSGMTYTLPDSSNYYYSVSGPDGVDTIIMITVPQPLGVSIDWIQASLYNNNFSPQINGQVASASYMAQVIASNIMPYYGTNWTSAYTTFTVGSGGVTTVVPSVSVIPSQNSGIGMLEVTSSPAGAKVFINGEERGVTPLIINRIPYGTYEVNIISGGYYSFKRVFEIDSTSPYRISATLSKIQGGAVANEILVFNRLYSFEWPSVFDVNESMSYGGNFVTFNLRVDQSFGDINSISGLVSTNYAIASEFMNIRASQTSQIWRGRTFEYTQGVFKIVVTVEDFLIKSGAYGQADTFSSVKLDVKVYYVGN